MKIGVPALLLALIAYPFVLNDAFYHDIGVALLLAAISASAWNIVGGYAGQVSVGHGMFFGIGAYVPLLVYQHGAWPPVAGVPIAILLSVLLAAAIGYPTFRLRGHYFSMATIAVAELIRIYVGTVDYLGAAIGLQGPAVGRAWWDLTFRGELAYYYIFLAVLAVLLYVTFEVQRSRFGSYLGSIRANERAAASLGVPVRQTKLKALMLSAAAVSLAFLVSYSLYHYEVGDVRFQGYGWVRPAYFTILITHITLAVAIVPLATITLWGALHGNFRKHRRIARWTWPIWIYVSITGVVVYVMCYRLYPPGF